MGSQQIALITFYNISPPFPGPPLGNKYRYTPQLLGLNACRPEVPCSEVLLSMAPATPIQNQLQHWQSKLAPHPDPDFKSYILSGIQSGFRIGFDYKSFRCSPCTANMPSAKDHRQIIDDYLAKEMKKGGCWAPSQKVQFLRYK